MIRDLLIQERVEAKLAAGKTGASAAVRALRQRDAAAMKLSQRYRIAPEQLVEVAEKLRQTIADLKTQKSHGAFMPRDPDASILQSALEQFYRKLKCVAPPKRGFDAGEADPLSDVVLMKDPLEKPPTRAALVEFGIHDPRWVFAFIAAQRFAAARGVCDFPEDRAPRVKIGKSARLVMVGDWASGIRRARDVADQMERVALEGVAQKRDTHVICLGDVYYAGFDDEYADRCLSYWPVIEANAGKIKSWALNGNHDMYAGGYGYFRSLLGDPRFKAQNGSSFFLLENASWRIAGLDSAYDPPDRRGERGNLYGRQAEWLEAKLGEPIDAKPAKRTMLLSHHQPFSAWEKNSPLMQKALRPVFDRHPIDAWFWGHEHRCAVYRGAPDVKFASLIGHGGVPVKVGKPGDRRKAPFTYEYREQHISGYQYLGFAAVDLDDDSCVVTYYNERGDEHHREVV